MQTIKNVICYSAQLPHDVLELERCLESVAHVPVLPSMVSSAGFVSCPESERFVSLIEGGCSFVMQLDEKVLPGGPVKKAKADAVAEEESARGEKLNKQDRNAVHERVMSKLVETALVASRQVRAIYWKDDNLLLVLTTSKPLADIMVSRLIRACESVKTTTIHVDGVRNGLTARLRNHLEDLPKDFGELWIGSSVTLKNEDEKLSVDVDDIDRARAGLLESIHAGMTVDQIELGLNEMSFVLDKNFRLKKIRFPDFEPQDEEEEDWTHQAFVEATQVAAAIRELCRIFGRQTEIEIDAQEEPDAV